MNINKKLFKLFFIFSVFNIAAEQKTFITAIPKCGTHLIGRLVMLITHQTWMTSSDNLLTLSEKTINTFNTTPNIFLGSHAVASLHNIKIIKKNNYKGIFIFRDPRDQVVSFAHYARKIPWVWPHMSNKSFDEIMLELITHVGCTRSFRPDTVWNIPELESFTDINSLYLAYLDWIQQPFIYTTTFEKLIGPCGGGSQEIQLNEIIAIAHHLGVELAKKDAQKIALDLFNGNTSTFRKGVIGEWKTHFKTNHKELFKEVAGQLLIDLGYERDFNW